jgi:ketosteroid isomerase-like protein
MDWVLEMGKYDYKRWKRSWQGLFDNYALVHNRREIKKIVISKEKDGAFAVVDIDTLWMDSDNNKSHWKGRVCKVYTKLKKEWKLIMHTGVLEY